MTREFITYRKREGSVTAYRHYGPPQSGKTTLAVGMLKLWLGQGRPSAFVAHAPAVASFYATAFDLPRGCCLPYSALLFARADRYRALVMDDCERFDTSEGDPVDLAIEHMSRIGEPGVVNAFYCTKPGQAVLLGHDWQRVNGDVLASVPRADWKTSNIANTGLPASWFMGQFGDTEEALRLFRLERVRQVVAKGYKPEHDDAYVNGELLAAAQCYVLAAFVHGHGIDLEGDHMPTGWPWAPEHWKPSGGPLSCIVKAGALMLAELERRKRAEAMSA